MNPSNRDLLCVLCDPLRSLRPKERRLLSTAILLFLLIPGGSFAASPAFPTAATEPAKGMFLIAGREMTGPVFGQSVILLIKADAGGAYGLIVNRPTPHTLKEAVPGLSRLKGADSIIFRGGPVEPFRVQILFRKKAPPTKSYAVMDDLHFSDSEEVLVEMVGSGISPLKARIFAGYAGWAPGQLEQEIERGDWHLLPADTETLFTIPPDRMWKHLIPLTGTHWVWWEMPPSPTLANRL